MKTTLKILVFLALLLFLQGCGSMFLPKITDDYARSFPKNSERKVQVVIPELFEMMRVATALTASEQQNPLITDTTTQYYKEVMAAFKPYQDHALVKRLNKSQKKAFWRLMSMSAVNLQSTMYDFKEGKITNLNRYKMPFLFRAVPTPIPIFKKNRGKIEDFYQKTNFAAFYQKHKSYYDNLILQTKTQSNIEDIWMWLEDNFPNRKQAFSVTTSSLLGGVHSTIPMATRDKTFSEMVCWVSPIENTSTEARFGNQKMFMTEIDENYAHVPLQYLPELEKAMNQNFSKWNNGNAVAKNYKGAESTFNENFTHAVMACYGYDRYEPAVFEKKWGEHQRYMKEKRGFPMFKEFSDELLRLYKNRKQGEKVSDLFAPMVAWVKKNA